VALVGALALGTGFSVWSAQPVATTIATPPAAAATAAGPGNDGLYITFQLGGIMDGHPDLSPQEISWLKPGQALSSSLNWAEQDQTRTTVAMTYGVEQDAQGRMTATIALSQKDNAALGTNVSTEHPNLIRIPVTPGRVARFEQVVGHRGTKIAFEVHRDAGPCHGLPGRRDVLAIVQDGGFDCIRGGDAAAARAPSPETYTPPPVYPAAALKSGTNGSVTVRYKVGRDGRVLDANVVSGTPAGFDAEALRTVRQWRVQPAMKDGVAVEAWRETRLSFEVPKDR
jgi:TonB family protein